LAQGCSDLPGVGSPLFLAYQRDPLATRGSREPTHGCGFALAWTAVRVLLRGRQPPQPYELGSGRGSERPDDQSQSIEGQADTHERQAPAEGQRTHKREACEPELAAQDSEGEDPGLVREE